jgi:hypothetical protein
MQTTTEYGDLLRDVRTCSNHVRDNRRELEWYHEVRAYRSDEGLKWIIKRFADLREMME